MTSSNWSIPISATACGWPERRIVGLFGRSQFAALRRDRENVKKLFPRAGNFEAATFWSGLRPATPSNMPYVGRTRYRNLWLNTGHGTLGWTLGAGSGFRIAEMIAAGEGPVVA